MVFESAIQLIATNIEKVFGLGVNSVLTLILGSFIVGYICLTFYYKIYNNNELWTKLEFSEKAAVSSVIGFLSISVILFGVSILQLIYINNKEFEPTLAQLYYIAPFMYVYAFSILTAEKNYVGLDFIKEYILISFWWIGYLLIAFVLVNLYFAREWIIIFVLLLLIIAFYGYAFYRYRILSKKRRNRDT